MLRVFNQRRFAVAAIAAACVTACVMLIAPNALAEARDGDTASQWVPAIAAFGGLVSARAVSPSAPDDWAGPEEEIEIGDTIEVIQVIMLPEAVAIAAGLSEAAPRFVRAPVDASSEGSGGEEQWLLLESAASPTGSQRADGLSPEHVPTDAIEGDDIAVPPPGVAPAAAAAPAEAVASDETERWVPSVAIFSGVVTGEMKADVSSSLMAPRTLYKPAQQPPPFPRFLNPSPVPAQLVRPAARGDSFTIEPFIGGNVEVMTPGLQQIPGRPRLYVAGDASWSFGFNRDIAKEGDPGFMRTTTDINVQEPSIQGQGSRSTVEPRDFVLGANAGIAFTLDLGERRFRIKPNVGYLRQEIGYTGSVNRAILIAQGRNNFASNQPDTPPIWQLIKMDSSDEETYHSIGPGLELEFDAARAGPVMLTLYATGNAYRVVSGDRKIQLEGEGTWQDYVPGFNTGSTRFETAEWNFERDPWSYRGAVGLRFRWVPE